ncbi:helix-turn-helix transcriptional regulator [Humibacter albus]|uniref:helix-turn-helix transcriptional regulator n=1 Tax=Humibacter albus TaxID=427754 RepID=UPI0004175718|nr:PAS domain-containing protein [Humibacter albus]
MTSSRAARSVDAVRATHPTSDRTSHAANELVEPPYQPTIDGERLIAVFSSLVEPLGRSLPSSTEVVLHDLSKLPDSIVAIHGTVTGRRVGDPATDYLLEKIEKLTDDNAVGYETHLPDGRRIRSSTMIIRDISGQPVAALCLNSDLSVWESVQSVVTSMLGIAVPTNAPRPLVPAIASQQDDDPELFATDVDQLAAHLIKRAVATIDVPVELMQKKHKVAVVRDLKDRGMFHLRDAVDMVAASLGVTRFTIYNYLNEIGDDEDTDPADETTRDKESL